MVIFEALERRMEQGASFLVLLRRERSIWEGLIGVSGR
jgi:hypothetical protein